MDLAWLGSMPQAVATAFAACVAWKISNNWRRQEIGKRRQAVAEEALLIVSQVSESLRRVRQPMVWAGEMVDDAGKSHEGDVGVYHAMRRRMKQHQADFDAIQRAILITDVHFGKAASQSIREIIPLVNRVMVASDMLADRNASGYELPFRRQLEADRHAMVGGGRTDPLGDAMQKIVDKTKALLQPHMRMPGERDPDAPVLTRWQRLRMRLPFSQPRAQ